MGFVKLEVEVLTVSGSIARTWETAEPAALRPVCCGLTGFSGKDADGEVRIQLDYIRAILFVCFSFFELQFLFCAKELVSTKQRDEGCMEQEFTVTEPRERWPY